MINWYSVTNSIAIFLIQLVLKDNGLINCECPKRIDLPHGCGVLGQRSCRGPPSSPGPSSIILESAVGCVLKGRKKGCSKALIDACSCSTCKINNAATVLLTSLSAHSASPNR